MINILQFFPSGSLDEDDSGNDALTYQSSFHSSKTRKCAIPVPANQADTEREANSISIELGEPNDGEIQADSFRKELEETSPAHEEDVESFSEELAELAEVAPSDILSTSAETRATTKFLESSSSVILAQTAGLSEAVYSAHTADSTTSMELVALGISTKRMKFSEATASFEMAPSVETHATTLLLESTSLVTSADSAKTSEAVFSVQTADLTKSAELVAPVKSPEQVELSDVGESLEADVLSNLIDSVNLTTTIIPTQLVPSMALPDSTAKPEIAQLAESVNITTSPEATPADTCVSTKNANIAQMKAILSSFELPHALKIKGRRPSLSHTPMIAIKEEDDDENNDI